MRPAPKVMPSILLCWPMMSEADVDGAAVEVEPFYLYSITFCCSVIAAAAGRCDKMVPDMEVHRKQRCGIEILHLEKIAPVDIH